MLGFLVMFSLVFLAFTALFYLLFHPYLKQYSTWLHTSLACFEMISVRFSTVIDMIEVDPFTSGISLSLFIFLAIFTLSNMFISIIVDNFNFIRREYLKRPNEIELLQFVIEKMKLWLSKWVMFCKKMNRIVFVRYKITKTSTKNERKSCC